MPMRSTIALLVACSFRIQSSVTGGVSTTFRSRLMASRLGGPSGSVDDVARRPCLCLGCPGHGDGECRQLTDRGPRCQACAPEERRRYAAANPSRSIYNTYLWRRIRARVLREWRRLYGPWCPGWGTASHVSHDLTVDHIVAVSDGGAPYDRANLTVLCRGCNTRKRHGVARGVGVPPR